MTEPRRARTSIRAGCGSGARPTIGSGGLPISARKQRLAYRRWQRPPATRTSPAWIGVGTNDLFHDEALAYAERLRQASVPVTLNVVPGAYHGFDVIEKRVAVSRAYRQAQLDALSQAWVAEARRR